MALAKSLRQGLGNWVDGDRFFDREKEMALFRAKLLDRVSLLLVAPRRIGKTSFMREAGRQLSNEIIALHVDLQKSASPEEAMVELGLACKPYAGAWGKVAAIFGEALEKIEGIKLSEVSLTLRRSLSGDNWQQKGDELVSMLAGVAENGKKPVVIFFDEVPILVNRILKDPAESPEARRASADKFMSWVRDNALRHKDHVVFVITGSIGLEPVLRTVGLSGTINALHAFELLPWSDEIAKACLLALSQEKGFPLPPAVALHMVSRLGCAIPHHVQMYFDQVRTAYVMEDKAGDVTIELVDAVYESNMTGLRGHADLMHMEERLRFVLNDHLFELALTILTEAAVVGRFTPAASAAITRTLKGKREDLLETLSILEHDGYLKKSGEDFVYVSHLVRDWWKKRFGYSYVPAK